MLSKSVLTTIIRRPHAYEMKRRFPKAKIPGILFLDENGKFKGAVALPSAEAVEKIQAILTNAKKSTKGKASKKVAYRIGGMKKASSGAT